MTISLIAQEQARDSLVQTRSDLEACLPAREKLVTKTYSDIGIDYAIVGAEDDELNQFRPYLPESLRFLAFQKLHRQIHQGKEKTYDLVSTHYFWPKLRSDILKWTKACPECQKCKISRHTRQKLQFYPTGFRRLAAIHIDLMGPLPVAEDYSKYVMTMRDRRTGFLATAALLDKTASSVVAALKIHFISSFGVPGIIVSDNGKEFQSSEFNGFCADLGITHKFVTAYHPSANGIVERVHRTMKVALRALDHPGDWAGALPLITLAINNQVCDFTPYQMVFGQAARLPGTFFFRDNDDTRSSLQPVAEIHIFPENMRHLHHSARK